MSELLITCFHYLYFVFIAESFPCASLGFCSVSVSMVNGSNIAAMTTDNQSDIVITDLDSGSILNRICPMKYDIKPGMCMSIMLVSRESGSTQLLAGYEEGRVALWDVTSETLLSDMSAHQDSVTCLDYSSTLNKGISGSVDNIIKIWTIDNKSTISCLRHIEVTNSGLSCAKYRVDSKLFVMGGWDHKVRVFHGKSCKPLAVLSFHKDTIQCVTFHTDNTLAVGSKDGTISIWSIYK